MMSAEDRKNAAEDPYAQLLEGNETVEDLDRKSPGRKNPDRRFPDRKSPDGSQGKRKRRRWVIPAAAGAAALVTAVAVFAVLKRSSAVPRVPAVLVEKKELHQITEANGTVESNHLQICASPVTASLAEALPEPGRMVKKGDVVVSFDTAELENAWKEASLSENASTAESADTIAKAEQGAADLQSAAAGVQSLEGAVDQQRQVIYSLNASIANRQAEISAEIVSLQNRLTELQSRQAGLQTQVAQLQTEQQTALQAGQDYDSSALDQAGSDLDAVSEEMVSVQQQINSAPSAETDSILASGRLQLQAEQDRLADLQAELSEARSRQQAAEQAGLSQEGRDALQANDDLARLNTMTAQQRLDLAKAGIQAEFDGVVVSRGEADKGSAVTEGMELLTIADRSDLSVKIRVPKSDYGEIREGQAADIRIEDHDYTGTVESVSGLVETDDKGASVLTAQVRMNNPDENAVIGIDAQVSVHSADVGQALVIPSEILNSGVDEEFVYTVSGDGTVQKTGVTVGIRTDTEVEIRSGLSEGETVLRSLPDSLHVGDAVIPVPDQSGRDAAVSAVS
jgi:HlyD family secretion protein